MTAYRVELDLFKGPLDLLLFLVRRDELDVRNLPLARVVRQFNEFLSVIELIDIEMAAEFVLMASTLAEIKSRLVLPSEEEEAPADAESVADPRTDLIKQLLEYRRYKEAAAALEERAAEWQERYPRLSNDRPQTTNEPAADLIKEVELWDLVSALARVLEKKVLDEEARIRDDDTPIGVYVEQIGNQVREKQRVAFTTLFDEASHRSRIISIFLAILELLRHHHFRAEQSEDFEEIWLLPPLETAPTDETETTSPPVSAE